MKINLKNNKGFTTIDLSIAMLVALIFITIMTSMFYNTYTSSVEAKRTALAVIYAVDIFEHIGELDFAEVEPSEEIFNIESFNDFVLNTSESDPNTVSGSIGTYNISVEIEDYEDDGLIKIVTLTINYPVSRSNNERLEFQRLKLINNNI